MDISLVVFMAYFGQLREIALLGFGFSCAPIFFIPWFLSWAVSHILRFIIGKKKSTIFFQIVDEFMVDIYFRAVILIFEQLSPCRVSFIRY